MSPRPAIHPFVASLLAGGTLVSCESPAPPPPTPPKTVDAGPLIRPGGVPVDVKTGLLLADGSFEEIGALNPGQTLAIRVQLSGPIGAGESLSFAYSASEQLDSATRRASAKWHEGREAPGDPLARVFPLGVVASFVGPNRSLCVMTTITRQVSESGRTRDQDIGRSAVVTFAPRPS